MEVIDNRLQITIQKTSVLNYALQQNKLPIIQKLVIHNDRDEDYHNVKLMIWSSPEMVRPLELNIEIIPMHTSFVVKEVALVANGEYLAGLTERIEGILFISLNKDEEVLHKENHEITALAFDEWHGSVIYPELLVSFVTPNHPEVIKINAKAAELLGKWTGDPSLNAYQTQNANRVVMQTAAVYASLQSENIIYSVPPASFEAVGQRVRLCDAVIQQKMGTCLDLTLFYVSCLEAIGLHPLLLLQKGHIFAGVWLEENTFPECVGDDPALITKRLADGVNEITVVECTALVDGKKMTYDNAVAAAMNHLSDLNSLQLIIDVKRARLSGIRPLPIRIQDGAGWRIEKETLKDYELQAPSILNHKISVIEEKVQGVTGKLAQWERKLLDLGLRNSLINLRLSQSIIPLLFTELNDLEDALSQGQEYGIAPKLVEWNSSSEEEKSFEQLKVTQPFQELLRTEFQNRRLRSTLTPGELDKTVVHLYRTSRTSLEENGANTLYLALGFLRWYETETSQKPRYAPLVLLPVEIIRKSANRGYIIRLREDEPQMNITLLEMLKQDFGIQVTGLDPLPQDDHGIDIRSVFTAMRKAVMGQTQWDVLEASCLGIFSFSQFVMWNDIRNRSEDIKKNKIVNSLIHGKLTWEYEPMELGEKVSEEDVLLPITVDASQLYAVKAAAEGKSFVLHGPPGTGKSQTITVMIANALAQGKTVLFVAEKMAALSVVQKRLNSIGLGPFCLEIHSNKSKKSDVLEQLRIATEVGKVAPVEEYEKKARQIGELRKELDAYGEALHRIQKSGLTLYQMVSGYEEHGEAPEGIQFNEATLGDMTEQILEHQKMLIQRIVAAARVLGHPKDHPLQSVGRTTYSNQIRMELPEGLSGYEKALDEFALQFQRVREILELEDFKTYDDIETFMDLCQEIYPWKDFPRTWNNYREMPNSFSEMKQMATLFTEAKATKRKLLNHWTEEFLSQNGSDLKATWVNLSRQWFLLKLLGQNGFVKKLRPYANQKISKDDTTKDLILLEEYQSKLGKAQWLYGKYESDIAHFYKEEETEWDIIGILADKAKETISKLSENRFVNRIKVSYSVAKESSGEFEKLSTLYGELIKKKEAFYSLLEIQIETPDHDWIQDQKKLIRQIGSNSNSLKEWMIWQSFCEEARELHLGNIVDAYKKGLDHKDAEGAYYKGLYQGLINYTVDREEVLQRFSGALFNEKIHQFKKLDYEITELAKSEIYYRLACRVPNFSLGAASSSELGILQKAIRSNGRGVSIRKLFEQIPNLLPRLSPCMLMSPISAAQYLDPKRTPFDLVIFDEASQMPTCKAVGALARAENAIIVGDPKQMPPTSFFMGNMVDEENLAEEDLDSILDDCLALNMPQSHLLWHYRSRHESLIAFSNNQFYENKLYTFPSVNDRESKVRLIPVEGYFDRGKTRQNRGEAEAIVKELIRRCYDSQVSQRSVGIVTFNIPQQNLIEDLFMEACKTDTRLEDWAYNGPEPIFIKNLENVQGDERDIILFSIGYGPDQEGKLYMNFGPLNRDGGWRRLNVAVSRSRHEMMVFSTLKPDQINLSRSASEGVAALKSFLEYANNSGLEESHDTIKEKVEINIGIANHLADNLIANGYVVEKNIGFSKFRIDLGVIDPKNPERYLLGILLDGTVYGKSKTTRDREMAQIGVLKGLGWNIHRIWTVDWWDNQKKEMERLIAYLKELENGMFEQVYEQSNSSITASASNKNSYNVSDRQLATDIGQGIPTQRRSESTIDSIGEPRGQLSSKVSIADTTVDDRFQEYQVANLRTIPMTSEEYLLPQNQVIITNAIQQVLEIEAPISEGLLTRRVLQSFGISRAGSRMHTKTEDVLRLLQIPYTEYEGQKTYWLKTQNPGGYKEYRVSSKEENKRDAKDIPVIEMANAIRSILEEQIGLPKEDLIKETAKRLGYARSGNIVISSVTSGLEYGIEQKIFKVDEKEYMTLV